MKVRSAVLCLPALFFFSDPAIAERLALRCGPESLPRVTQATLEKFEGGYWAAPSVFMARSPEQWDNLMCGMAERGELVILPAPPAPKVDWKRCNVIVVSMGELPTNGYDVEIRGVRRGLATAMLDIQVNVRGPLVSQVVTFPFHMIEVDKPGIRGVEICSETYLFDGMASRGRGELTPDSFTNLTPPPPPAYEETWGAVKSRFYSTSE